MNKIESHIVPALKAQQRISDYIPGKFNSIISKKGMKKALDKGFVKMDGERAYTADYVKGGEVIELYQKELSDKTPSIKLDLEILYEDDFLAIINKPPGILVSGNQERTIENALDSNLEKSEQFDALPRPQAIHRLDFPTSGALLIGKTRQAVLLLNNMFADRKVEKYYLAVTIGKSKKEGKIANEIKGKKSETHFELLDKIESTKYESLNLLKLKAVTGRRHQLRIHMSEMGNPILGDVNYGQEGKIARGNGLYLHAHSIQFLHPISTEEVKVVCPIPKKFIKLFPNMDID